jgi:hypothetical protein
MRELQPRFFVDFSEKLILFGNSEAAILLKQGLA